MKNTIKKSAFAFIACLTLMACEETEVAQKEPVIAKTVRDIAADPTTPSTTGGRPTSTGKFTFFSFKDEVLSSADSASTKWDLAFRGTTILTNGGVSGPGQGGAAVKDGIFSEMKEVPAGTSFAQDASTGPAIPTGSGTGWYNYNPATNLVTPIAGKVMLVRTADGKFAKFEVLSYYKGAPANPTAADQGRFYTIRYAYQPDGSMKFE